MATMDSEYEHECCRAELLGLPKPTWEEFLSSRTQEPSKVNDEEELTTEEAEEKDARKEGFQRIGGGLDELNSILSSTQKKLNRFKTVCGSFSNLLKLHIGNKKEDDGAGEAAAEIEEIKEPDASNGQGAGDKKIIPAEVSQHITKEDKHSELDKLDSLINKAERAELSLSRQNKQMRKFLN